MSSKTKRRYNPYKKYCCVYGCLNRTNSESDLTFFKIPNDIERQQEWLTAIDREDLLDENQSKKVKYNYICSAHFDDSAIITTTIKRLKSDAAPTKLLPRECHMNVQTDTRVLTIISEKTSTQDLPETSKDISSNLQIPSKKDQLLVSTHSHTNSQTDTQEQKEIKSEIIESDPESTVLSEPRSNKNLKTIKSISTQTDLIETSNKTEKGTCDCQKQT